MLYFHVSLQYNIKFLVLSEYYNQFSIYQPFPESFLEPRQSNLNKPEVFSEPCQTSKMECFVKIFND